MNKEKLILVLENIANRNIESGYPNRFLFDDEAKAINEAVALLKGQEAVVRCKDCKHRPKEPNFETYESGFDLEFPEVSKCPCRCSGDEWYSWYPVDEWFCADGERKEGG